MRFDEFYNIITRDRTISASEEVFFRNCIMALYRELNSNSLTEREVFNYSRAFGAGIVAGLESACCTMSGLEEEDY